MRSFSSCDKGDSSLAVTRGGSSLAVTRGGSSLAVTRGGSSLAVTRGGFLSSCGSRASRPAASLAAEHGLSGVGASVVGLTGLVAPRHVESSLTRDRTCVPCMGRWILIHCTTREVPYNVVLILGV